MKAIAYLVFLALPLPAQNGRFGYPACSGADQELAGGSFFRLCHSGAAKVPLWVGYELKPAHLQRLAVRPKHFRRDSALVHAGASDSDYRGSGFTRGHMAPAADFAWSEEAIRATFVLSNAVPQRRNPNTGRWAQLEARVRALAAVSDAVHVFSGPVFDSPVPEVIGAGRVAVPSHTYKVILAIEGSRKTMYAAILPNQSVVSGPLQSYAVTVREVERRTGLDFFSGLEDTEERLLESMLLALP
jgi:endonuclease G